MALPALARLRHRLVEQVRDPGTPAAGLQVHQAGQGRDQRVEGVQVAGDEATHDDRLRFIGRRCRAGSQYTVVVGHGDRFGVVAGGEAQDGARPDDPVHLDPLRACGVKAQAAAPNLGRLLASASYCACDSRTLPCEPRR